MIWDLADREKAGSLDIIGLAIAIKLVALIQNGHLPINENLKYVTWRKGGELWKRVNVKNVKR